MKLSTTQIDALKVIASNNNMRILVTKNQIGIGPSGQPWFSVVYTDSAKLKWQLRNKSDAGLRDQMKAVIG